jgi:hypothetical protein
MERVMLELRLEHWSRLVQQFLVVAVAVKMISLRVAERIQVNL